MKKGWFLEVGSQLGKSFTVRYLYKPQRLYGVKCTVIIFDYYYM